MKYVKPEIVIKNFEIKNLASLNDWLSETDYVGADASITNYLMGS